MVKMKYLKVIVFSALFTSFLGLLDWLVGICYQLYQTRTEYLKVLVLDFWAGRGAYFALGVLAGVIFALVFTFISSKERDWSRVVVGVLSAIFLLCFIETFAQIRTRWKLFLDLLFFSAIGGFAGYGVSRAWEWFYKRFFKGQLSAVLALFLNLLLSGLFICLWVNKFKISTFGKLEGLILSGLIFLFGLWLAQRAFTKKSLLAEGVYLIYFLFFFFLPLGFFHWKIKVKDLGEPKNPLNIIWIISDACRADAIGFYSGKNKTPHIDQLAEEGVVFLNAYSQAPWTLPSMFSMFSSFYPSILGIAPRFKADESIEFISRRLKSYGYYNWAIIANAVLKGSWGLLNYFDYVEIYRTHFWFQRLVYQPVFTRANYYLRRFLKLKPLPDTATIVTEKAKKLLKKKKHPFFLWLHYMNPHQPYDPPERYLKEIKYNGFLKPPFMPHNPFHIPGDYSHPTNLDIKLGYVFLSEEDKEFVRQLYYAEVKYLDEKIGELVRLIKQEGLEKNTVIIFTSDHGEELWDHYQWEHGHTLYQELIHIPLIIWGAGLKPRVVKEPVRALDLLPTLADLIGIKHNPHWQGKSFINLLKGLALEPEQRIIFAEGSLRPEDLRAVLKDGKKLIVGFNTKRKWFFDLTKDPSEKLNIYQASAPSCQELEKVLIDWIRTNQHLRSQLKVQPLSAWERKEQEEKLRALGYIR